MITKDIHGKTINCIIKNKTITDAIILYDKPKYYILQDIFDGSPPPVINSKKFGKKFSWCIGRGDKGDLFKNQTSNIYIINQEYELY